MLERLSFQLRSINIYSIKSTSLLINADNNIIAIHTPNSQLHRLLEMSSHIIDGQKLFNDVE